MEPWMWVFPVYELNMHVDYNIQLPHVKCDLVIKTRRTKKSTSWWKRVRWEFETTRRAAGPIFQATLLKADNGYRNLENAWEQKGMRFESEYPKVRRKCWCAHIHVKNTNHFVRSSTLSLFVSWAVALLSHSIQNRPFHLGMQLQAYAVKRILRDNDFEPDNLATSLAVRSPCRVDGT